LTEQAAGDERAPLSGRAQMAKTKEGEAAKKAAAEAAAAPPEAPPPPPPTPIEQLRANTELLEKAVRAKETRVLSGRLLRQTAAVRRALDADTLAGYVREALPAGLPARDMLLDALSKARAGSQRRQQRRCSLLARTAGQEPDCTASVPIVRCHTSVQHVRHTSPQHWTPGPQSGGRSQTFAAPGRRAAARAAQAGDGMETDAAAPPAAPAENGAGAVGLLPEVEAYAFLLVVTLLVDRKQYPEVRARPRRALRARTRARWRGRAAHAARSLRPAAPGPVRGVCAGGCVLQGLLYGGVVVWWEALTLHGCVSQAKALVTEALKRLAGFNRRTLDALAARLYFYYSWAHECTGTLADIRRWRPRPLRPAAPGTPWTQTRIL